MKDVEMTSDDLTTKNMVTDNGINSNIIKDDVTVTGDVIEDPNNCLLVIPYWIKKALDIHNLNYIDVLDLNKLKTFMSTEDLAELHSVMSFNFIDFNNKSLTEFIHNFNYVWVYNYWCKTPLDRKIVNETISPLGNSQKTIDSVVYRLTKHEARNEISQPLDDYHSFSLLSNGMYLLILEKGFINALDSKEYRFKLIREYLQKLYLKLPTYKVSKENNAFKSYLYLL